MIMQINYVLLGTHFSIIKWWYVSYLVIGYSWNSYLCENILLLIFARLFCVMSCQ
jgi:hypothetical protein